MVLPAALYDRTAGNVNHRVVSIGRNRGGENQPGYWLKPDLQRDELSWVPDTIAARGGGWPTLFLAGCGPSHGFPRAANAMALGRAPASG